MNKRNFLILLIVATLVRLPAMFQPLWFDENFSLVLARMPITQLITATAADVHPPLYYLLTWLLYRIPSLPAWAIRIPSLLFSLMAIVVMRRILLNEIAGTVRTWCTLLLMALAPQMIWYASEARMYSLLLLLVLLAYEAWQDQNWGRLWLYVVLMAYTHNWGLFYAVALALVAALDKYHWLTTYTFKGWLSNLRKIIIVFAGAAICWVPWGWVMLHQISDISGQYWLVNASISQALLLLVSQITMTTAMDPLSLAVLFAWLIVGAWASRYRPAMLLMAIAPVGLGLLVSNLWQPVMLFRAGIASAPFIYSLLGQAVDAAWNERRRILVMAIGILPVLVMSWITLVQSADRYRLNFQGALETINAGWQAGDVIVSTSDNVIDLIPYTDKPVYFVQPCKPWRGSLTNAARDAIGFHQVSWAQLPTLGARVWLIGWRTPLMYQCSLDELDQYLADHPNQLVMKRIPTPMTYNAMWLIGGDNGDQ